MTIDLTSIKVGDKILFAEEKQRYKVRGRTDNFIVCTKPFNARKTVLYTIIDIDRNVRGRDNMIFCPGYETDEDISDVVKKLANGEMCVSYRNSKYIDLNIVSVKK